MLRRVAEHLSPPNIGCRKKETSPTPVSMAAADEVSDEIDATVWSTVSAAVAANDCEGMAATYHTDAVLVSSGG